MLRLPGHDLVRADPEEDRGRKHADRLQHAVVGHDDKTAPENLARDGEKFVQHHVAENVFRGGGFDRFDSFDRVDLVRAVFALAFLDAGEERPQHFLREIHQPAIERRRGEKRQHERRAVERHES